MSETGAAVRYVGEATVAARADSPWRRCRRVLRANPSTPTEMATANPAASPLTGESVARTEAATSAPVMPIPTAVPSESSSDRAAEAEPCSPSGATNDAAGRLRRPPDPIARR